MKKVEVEFRADNILCVIKVYGHIEYVTPFTAITINTDNTFTVDNKNQLSPSFLNYNGLCDVLEEAKKLSVVNANMKFEEFWMMLPTITEKFIEKVAVMAETNYIKVIGGATPISKTELLDYINIDIDMKDEKYTTITMVTFHDGNDSITILKNGVNGCRFNTVENIDSSKRTIIPLDISVFKDIFDNPTEEHIRECCEKVAYRYDYKVNFS